MKHEKQSWSYTKTSITDNYSIAKRFGKAFSLSHLRHKLIPREPISFTDDREQDQNATPLKV